MIEVVGWVGDREGEREGVKEVKSDCGGERECESMSEIDTLQWTSS